MQSNTIPLSISIVTYNTDATILESALASISSSTIKAKTYIVDNSKSKDLEYLANRYKASYLYLGTNLGYGSGHNVALRAIGNSSKYHLILNPDVSFGSSVLQDLSNLLERNPEVGWVMPNVLYPDGSNQSLCKRLPTPWDLLSRRFLGNGLGFCQKPLDRYECKDLDLTRPCQIPNLSGCFAFLRTELIQRVGGFDERFFLYLEDTDLVRRIGEVSLTVFYPYTRVYHVHGRGSYRNRKLFTYHLISAAKYFWKWGWFLDRKRTRANRLTASDSSTIAVPENVISQP